MKSLEISLLGTPTVLVEGRPFDSDRRKALALLAYLVVSGKPQPREQLAAFFWPDYDRESAFAYLRRTLFELNQGLGKGWLVTDRQTVAFDLTAGARIDTQIFEGELAAAHTAEDPLPHLEAALGQYRGEFMAGFILQDTDPFEDWLRLERESYRREYAGGLERACGVYERWGDWEAALRHAHAWLALDDFNETAHRAIMRSYAGMGDRSRAIRQYELCAQILKDQLGIQPLPETTELYNRIRQDSIVRPPRAGPPSTDRNGFSGLHLPVLTTPFIGRRTEVEQVKALILEPDNRLVTLFGPGGMGKTRLSIQVASEIGDRFADGAWFVPLANVQSTAGIVQEAAKTLNFSLHRGDSGGNETPAVQLVEYLQKKQLLLILDNIDHLASPQTADLLVEILTGAESTRLLVTSRARLNLPAEQVFPLPGMHTPAPAEVAAWENPEAQSNPFSAMQLFLDRARRIQPGFRLNQENAAAVAEICQLVSGMPLGIELAASWLELLPPGEIEAEIRRNLDFLETDQAGVPDRQRSIRAVFDYSWKLLNESQRQTFLSLCVFVGSFTREAAQKVSGASLRALLSLANKSWLQQVEGGRFQLHPLLQHYGLELLRQDEPAWLNANDRHAGYYAGFVAELSQRMRGPDQPAALEDFSREFDTNIKAAWEWLVAAGQWAEIREKMVIGLFQFTMIRWRGDELIAWMRLARLKLEGSPGRLELLTWAIIGTVEIYFEESWGIKEHRPLERLAAIWRRVENRHLAESMDVWFVVLGKIYLSRNPSPAAEKQLEAAVKRIRDQGNPWSYALALLILSSLYDPFPTGWLMETWEQNLQEALAIFRQLGVVYEQAGILSIMADYAVIKNLPQETVVDLLIHVEQLYLKVNDLSGIGSVYQSLTNLYFMRGYPQEGFQAAHEMRRIFEQLGRHRLVLESLSWESLNASRYSTYEHALETRQRCLDLRQVSQAETVYYWNLYEMGEIHRIFGNYPKSLEYYDESCQYFKRIDLVLGLGYCQRAMGDLAMQAGDDATARGHYQAYYAYAEQDNHIWSMAHAALKLAWANAHLGELEKARQHIACSMQLMGDAWHFSLELMALIAEARCLAEEGKIDPAVALAAFVAGHPLTWNEIRDLAKAMLAGLVEKLDEQTYQAATRQLEGREVRELTTGWLADYEAQHPPEPA